MTKVLTSRAIRFAQGRRGLHLRAENEGDVARLFFYLSSIGFSTLAGLEVDLVFKEIYLYFDSLESANLFLEAFTAHERIAV